MSPQKFVTRVSEKYFLTEKENFLLIKLALLEENNTLIFQAGQYVSLKINENGERRSYSIANTPEVDHAITLVAEMLPEGKGSTYLKNLKLGDEVELLAPLGQFVVSEQESNLLFVATGSGIVPLYTMICDELINKRNKSQMRLHWGMRSEEDLFWLDNLARLSLAHSNFVFDVVLSLPKEGWNLCVGHVQDCLRRDMAGSTVQDNWSDYVCGNPKMVSEVSQLLVELGMSKERVMYEKYA
jgi:NAD(P)H-flavin reductase